MPVIEWANSVISHRGLTCAHSISDTVTVKIVIRTVSPDPFNPGYKA